MTTVRSGTVGSESGTTNDRQECKDYDHFTRPPGVSLVSPKTMEREFVVGRKDDEFLWKQEDSSSKDLRQALLAI